MEGFFDFAQNGPTWIGLFLAVVGWYSLTRFKDHTVTKFVAFVGVFVAGPVLAFVVKGFPRDAYAEVLGRYAFGLVLGTAIYFVFYRMAKGTWPVVIDPN